jgi:putative membrane protein
MSPLVTLILMVFAVVYSWGWYRLRNDLPKLLSVWRLAAFMSGLCSLWAAVGSPLADMDHHLLTAHMLQHLLLMTVAAPLILMGAPAITLLYGVPRGIVRFPPLGAVGRILTHPVFCWLASTTTVIAWHVPALFAIGMRSEGWHAFEHGSFFVAGLLFWWPVIQPWPSVATWPRWCIPLYLFLATLPCDALSAFLTFCNRVVYPHYLSTYQMFDISPLVDQECAGALMWVWVTFAYLVPAAAVTIQMLSPQRSALNAEVV